MRRWTILLFTTALAAMVIAAGIAERPIHALTRPPITVNSTADPGTGGCNATECTLREAIDAANSAAGADTIEFGIPGTGLHTITPDSLLPDITERVTINGYSQPGATANTLKVGNNAALKIKLDGVSVPAGGALDSGLKIKADNSKIKGLVISNWENDVYLDTGATGNQVTGNFIGTDVAGSHPGNSGVIIQVDADHNTIGGTTAATRNIISGNNGIGITITGGTDNDIQGNYIGTNAAGDASLPNNQGVVLSNASNNTIGGTTAAERNIISGNGTWGILISDPESTGNKVQGNYIGTNADGTAPLGNDLNGVRIQSGADDNTIGGKEAGAGNIISGNGDSGVQVRDDTSDLSTATGDSILSNSIYDNNGLGIDLVYTADPPGVTCNDDGDPDGGIPPDSATLPNRLQNYPEISSAKLMTKRIGGHRRKVTVIKGTLNSTPSTATITRAFTLQFFGSLEADPASGPPPCGPASFGEGKRFLGQKSVTTNSSGDATFTFQTRKKVPKGQVVTATATDQDTGDTSEFSRAVSVS